MSDENEEERVREEEKRKGNKRGESKEVVTVWFLWRLLKSSVKGEIWRVVV